MPTIFGQIPNNAELVPSDIGGLTTALAGKVDIATTVNGHVLTGNIAVTAGDVGLGSVDNTSDANKPVSTATQTALDAKEATANKGVANGYAPLDAASLVPLANLPALPAAWGAITGALSAQTDLQSALDGKQASLGFTPENTANKAAASGYASLDAGTKVPIAQVPTGSSSATVCIGNDARLSDARTPTAHATSHLSNGSDAIAAASTTVRGTVTTTTATSQVASTDDSRLSDARTPLAHAASHKSGGSDAIKLDELAAPTDVTALNVSSTLHGLAPKSSGNATQFLNGAATPAYAAVKDSDLSTSDITTNDATTTKHGFLQKLPGGTSTFLRADGTFATPTASLNLTTAEISLGTSPRRGGGFTIGGLAGLAAGKPVSIQQASGPYTGKGTRTDEAEMDLLRVTGKVLNATTIQCYWTSQFKVRGNFKFDYVIGA